MELELMLPLLGSKYLLLDPTGEPLGEQLGLPSRDGQAQNGWSVTKPGALEVHFDDIWTG